jgi:ribosomal protein S18 acetylase RimI-like enzyme
MAAIRPLASGDFEAVRRLWTETEGLGRGPGDSLEGLGRFLARNPGLSLVAEDGAAIVGVILCGHDGRRGFIYHLAVAREHRRRGLAAELVRRCLSGLKAEGLERCLIVVVDGNEGALRFWESVGWRRRHDLSPLSIDL